MTNQKVVLKLNPFKTIERAQLAVRNNPQRGICGINVNIFGGVYTLTQPLVFTNLIQDLPKQQVVYQKFQILVNQWLFLVGIKA